MSNVTMPKLCYFVYFYLIWAILATAGLVIYSKSRSTKLITLILFHAFEDFHPRIVSFVIKRLKSITPLNQRITKIKNSGIYIAASYRPSYKPISILKQLLEVSCDQSCKYGIHIYNFIGILLSLLPDEHPHLVPRDYFIHCFFLLLGGNFRHVIYYAINSQLLHIECDFGITFT